MNAKMSKGTLVRDHVLNMTNYINEAELHEAIIDERTQVSIILVSLTHDFLQFTNNYVMNKLDYNVTQLLNELQPSRPSRIQGLKRLKQMLLKPRPHPLLTIRRRGRTIRVPLQEDQRRSRLLPKQAIRRRAPKKRNPKENVSTAESMGIRRETVTSISPN